MSFVRHQIPKGAFVIYLKFIFQQFLFQSFLFYRDLKIENFLLSNSEDLKIIGKCNYVNFSPYPLPEISMVGSIKE